MRVVSNITMAEVKSTVQELDDKLDGQLLDLYAKSTANDQERYGKTFEHDVAYNVDGSKVKVRMTQSWERIDPDEPFCGGKMSTERAIVTFEPFHQAAHDAAVRYFQTAKWPRQMGAPPMHKFRSAMIHGANVLIPFP